MNFGKSTQQGFELGVTSPVNDFVDMFANYSFQAKPDPKDFALSRAEPAGKKPVQRRCRPHYNRFMANLSVSYTDSAFWQDVLDPTYAGTTEAYTLVNASFGVKWMGDRFTTTVKAINLGNDDVQQHAFGDIIGRQIIAELRVKFQTSGARS